MLNMNSNSFHLQDIEEMGRIQLVAKMCHIWMSFYIIEIWYEFSHWIFTMERLNGSWQV